jgi:hypothetical protein
MVAKFHESLLRDLGRAWFSLSFTQTGSKESIDAMEIIARI